MISIASGGSGFGFRFVLPALLLSLLVAFDFDRWISKPGDKKPKQYNSHSIDGDRPDQAFEIAEQTLHELKEYEHSFDQIRRRRMQVSIC